MPNSNFANINTAANFSPEQRRAMMHPGIEASAGIHEHDPVDARMQERNREAFARAAGEVTLGPDVIRDPMDAVVADLRQPQHLDEYQNAEGFNQEADAMMRGERTLGEAVKDAQSGYYPETGTWRWESQDIEMPPARPELPPHSQN